MKLFASFASFLGELIARTNFWCMLLDSFDERESHEMLIIIIII